MATATPRRADPRAKRTYECPYHGEVTEDPRQRDERGFYTGYHCCETVGHRCGWDGDPDDKTGCHRRLQPSAPKLGPARDPAKAAAIDADPEAARAAALEEARARAQRTLSPDDAGTPDPRELVTGPRETDFEAPEILDQVMPVVSQSVGGRAVGPRVLQPLSDAIDAALAHVTCQHMVVDDEGKTVVLTDPDCGAQKLMEIVRGLRQDGLLPLTSTEPHQVAVTSPAFAAVTLTAIQAQYPAAVAVHLPDSGLVEIWTRNPMILPT